MTVTRLLSLRCMGEEGFWKVVLALTETDLGESCNREWGVRLEKLKHAARIRGPGHYAWSKPCEPMQRMSKTKSPRP